MRQKIIRILKHETATGVTLFLATVLALILGNSALHPQYHALLQQSLSLGFLEKSAEHWINDGLMALFFLYVGLEIKQEMLEGHLQTRAQITLPAIAALGGMLCPALIYVALNQHHPENLQGWAIPAATDIAFAVGVISLLGKRVPPSIKIFLMAVAVFDDIGAILIIALFYTKELQLLYLGYAAVILATLGAFNHFKTKSLAPYLVLGAILWYCIYKSGVHATIAGVLLGLLIPLKVGTQSPLKSLMHILHSWVSFLVLPLFALANAGIYLGDMAIADILSPLPLGIAAGLFFGKQLGVMVFTFLAVRLGLGQLPQQARWGHVYGAAILTGIGFTMSLFVSNLSFSGGDAVGLTRLGVLAGSAASAVVGYSVLRWVSRDVNFRDNK
jgi:NhaA family Na+:H+ antiporter